MRAVVLTFLVLAGLAAASAQAAPIAVPAKRMFIEAATAPPIELVREGCGWGGTVRTGATIGAIGIGAIAFRIGDFTQLLSQSLPSSCDKDEARCGHQSG